MKMKVNFEESNQSLYPNFSENSKEFSAGFGNIAIGKDGESAYQIALNNGFAGTEEEWLESLHGKDGYTPVKGVDYFDGEDGTDGYTPVKGVDYFDGKDGYTPVKGKDYTDGYTPIKGVDYFDGKDGKDGYTPVKGKDYWTAAECSQMVSDVLAALPTWEGGNY